MCKTSGHKPFSQFGHLNSKDTEKYFENKESSVSFKTITNTGQNFTMVKILLGITNPIP